MTGVQHRTGSQAAAALPGIGLAAASLLLVAAAPAAAQLSARQQAGEAQPARSSQAQPVRTTQTRPGAGTAAPAASAPVSPPPAPLPPPSAAPTEASRALARLDLLEAQQREMTDRIERLEAQIRQLETQNAALRGGAATAVADPAAPVPEAVSGVVSAVAPVVAPEVAPGVVPATAAAATPATAPATAPAAPVPAGSAGALPAVPDEPAVVMISAARTDLQVGAYDRAEARLLRMIELWPDAPETPEARWLLGETRFVTRAWAPATDAYVGYLRSVPGGPRTPEVLLRLAATFRELGDQRQRCLALERFGRAAPNPSPALRARADAEIARGTCPAPAAR